jgi:limonene 1,2-monooxygenase
VNWADFPATLRSYELIARYVMPRFQGSNDARRESMEWATKNRPRFMGAMVQAIGSELQKHTNELAARKKPNSES